MKYKNAYTEDYIIPAFLILPKSNQYLSVAFIKIIILLLISTLSNMVSGLETMPLLISPSMCN